MRSLCVFIHYDKRGIIPKYVLTYLKELTNYYTDIILATNVRTISNISELNKLTKVKTFYFKNEGYDFGLFYKSIHSTDLEIYDRVSFVNDSNILLNRLNKVFHWKKENDLDVWGLTDSYENVPNSKHKDSHHIQSHFISFEKNAIPYLYEFFEHIQFEKFFELELDKRELWLKIVEDCEIGISQYMKKKGMKIGAVYTAKDYTKIGSYKTINIHMILWKQLLIAGYPLIKKKIVNQKFDPIFESNVAKKIDADSAEKYINIYKHKLWKLDI